MLDLSARSAFSGHLHAIGNAANPGVTVGEQTHLGLATVFAREGFAQKVLWAYGIALEPGARHVSNGPIGFVGIGPGQWLAYNRDGAVGWCNSLQQTLDGSASVVDQSGGLGVLRVTGPAIRQVFEKGLPIDFHPSVFWPGSAAVTLVAHIGVTIWQLDDRPTYEIAIFRSLAGSFMHWLSRSAAEFGLAIAVDDN